jgi:hypothetical protein
MRDETLLRACLYGSELPGKQLKQALCLYGIELPARLICRMIAAHMTTKWRQNTKRI